MRSCRICLKTDILDEMIPCFEHPSLIKDLYFLSNVAIVEIDGNQVKICRRCAKNIKVSADFKRLCIKSDTTVKQTSNERFLWFSELQKLKISESIDVTESVNVTINEEFDSPADSNMTKELEDIVKEANIIIAEIDNYELVRDTAQFSQVEIAQNDPHNAYDFIEHLNYDQLKELSNDLTELFGCNDFGLTNNIINNGYRLEIQS